MSIRKNLILKHILYCILTMLSVTMTVSGQDLLGRSKKLFDKGLEFKRQGNYAGAAKNLNKIIKKYPKSDVIQETYYEYGAVLFKGYEWQYWKTTGLQKYFEALSSFRQVNTSVDSLLAKSLYMQARCFRKIHYRQAMAFYDSVTVLFPSHHLADDALFLSAYIDPNLQNSMEKYHQLRNQYPESEHDLGALYHLLQLYRKTGDYITSNAMCQEFIERYPDSYYYQSVFLYYVSNLLMSGEQGEAVKYVQVKAQEKQQLWKQIPNEYIDLPDKDLQQKAWNLRYEKDSTSQDNMKIIQSYLDTKATLNKAISILDLAIPKRTQPVLDKVDSLYFTTGEFQEYHVSMALESARKNLRNRNYIQAANISLDLVNNPLVRDPSEPYWILGRIYPRFYLPSFAAQSLQIAKPGLTFWDDRLACLESMIDYTLDPDDMYNQLREGISDTTFSPYNRVKLAARLMGELDFQNADISTIEAVWEELSDIGSTGPSLAHRKMASIYFGHGLLDKAEHEAELIVESEPKEAVNVLLRCAFYRRHINDNGSNSKKVLQKALGMCQKAGLERERVEIETILADWK